MRRTFVTLLAALAAISAAGAAAGAVRPILAGDGTLSIRDGAGNVTLAVRGAMIGRVDVGTLVVVAPAAECDLLDVWGWDRLRPVYDIVTEEVTRCVFAGRGIRFRLGGPRAVAIKGGRGIDLSAVGRGWVVLDGNGRGAGTYSLNGGNHTPIPDTPRRLFLSAD